MSRKNYVILSVSEKEKMFLEYKSNNISMRQISRKYGVTHNVVLRLVQKYNNDIPFDNFTGKSRNNKGAPKSNFENKDDELEYRRMVMAIEGKLRTLNRLKKQIDSD